MVTGWINNNAGKTRFFHPESGIMMEGRQKMDSSLYNTTDHYSYFEKKTGCLKTGQVRDTNGYRFYDNNGWEYGQGWTCIDGQYWIMINSDGYQLTGNQMMVGMMYHFSDKGRLLSMETSTPHYYQYAHNFPTGCGPTSLLMALQYKGKARDFSLERFMSQIPYTNTGNPTLGFVGNPVNYYLTDSNRAIYPKALAEFGKRFGNVTDISGCPTGYLTDELRMGNPSVVLVTWGYVDYPITNYSWGKFRDANHHYNVLVGYNFTNDEYKVMDCGRNVGGGYRWIKGSTFRQIWEGIRGAVVVRD